MATCTRCVLPDTIPGITFDEQGVCSYCRQYDRQRPMLDRLSGKMRLRFEELLAELRPSPGYHCLLAWSGGKDSTYTLKLMRVRYGLRVLALTFDNGYVSPLAQRNMVRVSEALGVDHVTVRPNPGTLRAAFRAAIENPAMYGPKALMRASSVCTACMSIAKGIMLSAALAQRIPLVVFGWSPGQVPLPSALFRRSPEMLRAMVAAMREPLENAVGSAIAPYFPDDAALAGLQEAPVDAAPLAFLEYDEDRIVESITALGWRPPDDTDANSTNCLLNAVAIALHENQMAYHPYAMELAGLVRQGVLDRTQALSRLAPAEDSEALAQVRATLGL